MAKAKKLPSGNWRVQASITIDGVVYKRSFTDKDKKVVELKAKQWQFETQEKEDITSITLHEAFLRYIKSKESVLSPSTVREYYRTANNSLKSIMNIKLSQITSEKIQVAINMEAAKLSPKSVRNIHGLLSAVLQMFRPLFILRTTLPEPKQFEPYVPGEEELKKLFKAIKGTELEIAVLLAALGPMRRGEICALTSEDIKGNQVTVNKNLVQDINRNWIVKTPKTLAGYRTIEYPDFVGGILKKCNGKVIHYNPDSLYSAFARALKQNGIQHFRFHDLRHYSASILHSLGYPDKYIMARGGWKSTTVLDKVYKHALKDKQKMFDEKANLHFESVFK